LNDDKISLADARNLLSEHISRTDPIVHISDIEAATSTFFGITTADMHSSRKDGTVSTARAFSMYLARKYTKMSYPEIGRLMGGKNHATVILACRKVDDMVARNLDVNWRSSVGNRIMKAQLIIEKLIAVVAG
jgi:chromosomal replication initiator protein